MPSATTVLEFDPDWEPPDDEDLTAFSVDKPFQNKVNEYHVGLKSIHIKGVWKNEDGQTLVQDVCTIKVKKGGTNKIPGIDCATLGRLIVSRAQAHADEEETSVKYKTIFYGDNEETGGPFQKQGSFTLNPSTDEDEEEDEEDKTDVSITRAPDVKVLEPALAPAQVRHMGVESEAVQLMRIQHQWSAGLFAELRTSQQQLRLDYSGALQSQGESYKLLLHEVRDLFSEVRKDLHHARDEVNKANTRILRMSEQNSAHFQGQQDANKAGWDAFRAGMQMQLQSMGQSMSWERQMMFMQFDALAKEKAPAQPSTTPEWIKDYGPLVLAAVGQVMSAKGNPQGEILQELALKAMDGTVEEIEVEEPVKKKKTEPVMGVASDKDPREHFEKNKLGSMLHLLDSMLKAEQKAKLKELLPPLTWGNLQAALQAKNEMMTKSFLYQFIAGVKQEENLEEGLIGSLSPEQAELFEDIRKLVISSLPTSLKSTIIDTAASQKEASAPTAKPPQKTAAPPPPPPPPPPKREQKKPPKKAPKKGDKKA